MPEPNWTVKTSRIKQIQMAFQFCKLSLLANLLVVLKHFVLSIPTYLIDVHIHRIDYYEGTGIFPGIITGGILLVWCDLEILSNSAA